MATVSRINYNPLKPIFNKGKNYINKGWNKVKSGVENFVPKVHVTQTVPLGPNGMLHVIMFAESKTPPPPPNGNLEDATKVEKPINKIENSSKNEVENAPSPKSAEDQNSKQGELDKIKTLLNECLKLKENSDEATQKYENVEFKISKKAIIIPAALVTLLFGPFIGAALGLSSALWSLVVSFVGTGGSVFSLRYGIYTLRKNRAWKKSENAKKSFEANKNELNNLIKGLSDKEKEELAQWIVENKVDLKELKPFSNEEIEKISALVEGKREITGNPAEAVAKMNDQDLLAYLKWLYKEWEPKSKEEVYAVEAALKNKKEALEALPDAETEGSLTFDSLNLIYNMLTAIEELRQEENR